MVGELACMGSRLLSAQRSRSSQQANIRDKKQKFFITEIQQNWRWELQGLNAGETFKRCLWSNLPKNTVNLHGSVSWVQSRERTKIFVFALSPKVSRKSFSLSVKIICKIYGNVCFPENFRINICFPESFSENRLKTGANTHGRMKKLVVFAKNFWISFAKFYVLCDFRENLNF